jgi:hypothetical protein
MTHPSSPCDSSIVTYHQIYFQNDDFEFNPRFHLTFMNASIGLSKRVV